MKPSRTMPPGKAYRTCPIVDCGEPMVNLDRALFGFFEPHPYVAAGAPYGGASPWQVRSGVAAALARAQTRLQALKPGWRLMIFDAYRPNAVQEFMVEREFETVARRAGLDPTRLTPAQREALAPAVFLFWGVPSADPATPPLHSTGGAVDCTLMDAQGHEVDMGSPIDETTERSYPDYLTAATDEAGQQAHIHRRLLQAMMEAEGFTQFHTEWWHFDLGDQCWAWWRRHLDIDPQAVARYGRADLVERRLTGRRLMLGFPG